MTQQGSRLSDRWQKFVGLSPSEQKKTFLLFTFFFLVIAAFWVQKPIRTSRFLLAIGVEYLPWVKLGTAILILPIMLLYSYFVKKLPREKMVLACIGVFVTGSLIFWYLFRSYSQDWVHYAYFFYVDIYITVMVTLFWSFANTITLPGQARRIYGFVGAGGILGGIFGSAITGWSVKKIGPSNLLLLCGIILLLIAYNAWALSKRSFKAADLSEIKKPQASWRDAIAGAKATLTTPYLLFIAGIVGCYEIVSNTVDYQFSSLASTLFTQEASLTSFLGKLSTATISLSIFFQVVLTTWILRKFGPKVGILILPLVLGLGSSIFLAVPIFTVMMFLFSSDGSLHYSLNQTSKEVLYTPLDEITKFQAKAFIDMFLFRLSKGISALTITLCNLWLVPKGWDLHHFSIFNLVIIGIWLFFSILAGKRYTTITKEPLHSKTISP